MYRYKRLLVNVTLTEQDATTIPYAALISRMAKSEKVYFVTVPKTLEVPEEICCEYPELVEPLDEADRHVMEEMVTEHFSGPPGVEVAYEVREGNEAVEILRLARQKNIDLIILGTERNPEERGTLPETLARKAPCSVLVVPDGAGPEIHRILVPVHFADSAAAAMDVAVAFAGAAGVAKIDAVHAYRVPPGFHKTGKTYEEFAEIMLGHAKSKFSEMARNVDLEGLAVEPVYVLDKKPFGAIMDTIAEQKTDLVVMAAKGRSPAAAILLGSVTERVVRKVEIPLVAVKKKGTGIGFLDALLRI